uniref:Methyltransferase FkbM domain-containing protein n=1 Tax=Panagrolaimus sp. ES5 TaxID=591445 RepID=A0AC34FKQ7_9BILA
MFLTLYFLSSKPYSQNNPQDMLQYKQYSEKSKRILSNALESQKCLESKKISTQILRKVWQNLTNIVEECSGKFFDMLDIQKLINNDEEKHFILPFEPATASCNVITLGIGGDVSSEEKLLKLMPQCNFLGVDSGAKNSKNLYKEKLDGIYIEGLVGAENGTYKASVMVDEKNYKDKILPHFSFKHIISNNFKDNLTDLLFMDIEGDEFALMKDMIDHPHSYPNICQINVEFHDPSKTEINVLNILDKMIKKGPYLIVKTEFVWPFNRMYLINIYDNVCLKKYLLN